MPGYKTHLTIGTATTATTLYITLTQLQKIPLKLPSWLLLPFIVGFFSLYPDLDSYTGKLRSILLKSTFLALMATLIIAVFFGPTTAIIFATTCGATGTILMTLRHRRSVFHKYWFIALTSLPLVYFGWYLALLAFINGAMHIFVDKTVSGLKRWWR